MENATKALLIAAAVLITILIISLGVGIYNKSSEAAGSVDLSAQQIQAFNDQYIKYNGNGKRGTDINALLRTALNNNLSERNTNNGSDTSKCVDIKVDGTAALNTTDGTIAVTIDASKIYDVVVKQDGAGGLVHTITITSKK